MAYVKIKRDDLKLVTRIGSGASGVVFKARWNGKDVAAKRVNNIDPHEVHVLAGLDHPNIVKLLGVVDENFDLYLVLELCKCSLRSYLDELKSRGECLSEEQIVDFARQAAEPIQYLKQKKIVHKDIKSDNYLIADGDVVKLADFGIARTIEETITKATDSGTLVWMAPELMRDGIMSPSLDIYSYGVVTWELCTTKVPFDEDRSNIRHRICDNKERPPIPSDCPDMLADVIRQCWHSDYKKRPTVEQILSMLLYERERIERSQRQLLVAGPWVLEREFGHHGGHGKLGSASGITHDSNGDVGVADYYNDKVNIYNSEGVYKHSLDTTQGLTPGRFVSPCPWDVITSSTGNYFVTQRTQYVKIYDAQGVYKGRWVTVSPDNKPSNTEYTRLHGLAMDMKGMQLGRWKTASPDNKPDNDNTRLCGLAMDGKGQLLVGASHPINYISKHREDGSHIASIKVGIAPYYLAVTSQDTIIISDSMIETVNLVDSTGQLLRIIRPPARVWDWFPRGVCCYKDIIFICNYSSHEICCFSVSGEHLRSFDVGGIPRCVTFAKETNRLLVSATNKVMVYRIT